MAGGIRKIKWRASGFDASVPFFSTSRQSSPCFAYVDLLTSRAGCAIDDIYGDACKVVSDFSGSIGY